MASGKFWRHGKGGLGPLGVLGLAGLLALLCPGTATAATWRTAGAGAMAVARDHQTAILLPNGKVLIMGGSPDDGATALSTAELYDPAAGAWSTTNAMATARYGMPATLLPNGKVLIAGGYSGTTNLSTAELYDPAAGTWSTTNAMASARAYIPATLLPNGKVLVAGGYLGSVLSTAELYDPAAGTWSTTNAMSTAKYLYSATLLRNGKVLIVGGTDGTNTQSSAELYDPGAGTWSTTNSMGTVRRTHLSILLASGKVLTVGGWNGTTAWTTTELYDPDAGTWSATGAIASGRFWFATTLLPNGKVLVTGGSPNGTTSLSTAELYDPAGSGTWSTLGSMASTRYLHTTVLLPNGKVLIAGGGNTILSTAELYDPDASAWSASGSISTAKSDAMIALLPDGKVLLAGGADSSAADSTAELYDPAAGTWSAANSMLSARGQASATLLPNGKVLVTGGCTDLNCTSYLSSSELYNPSAGTWSTTGSMASVRWSPTMTLLPNGKVLTAGGKDNSGALSTAEIYDPGTGIWSATNSMASSRYQFTALLLPNGKVLVVGGGVTTLSTAELYDPAAGTWSTTNSMASARLQSTLTLLPTGKILASGGSPDDGSTLLSTAELYDPGPGTWAATGSMASSRRLHAAILLPNGKVLVPGGAALSTSEIYDPASAAWTASNSLATARRTYASVLLPNGKVLVTGGWDGSTVLSTSELIRYTEHDYVNLTPSIQPMINTVNGSSVFPVIVYPGANVTVTGSSFTGVSGGSGGNYGPMNSPANLPRVYLRANGSGTTGMMTQGGTLVDLSTSVYANSFSSGHLTFNIPAGMTPGYYTFWVQSNAVPSTFTIINIQSSSPTTSITLLGPANTTPVSTTTPAFLWSGTGPYRLQVSQYSTFYPLVADTSPINGYFVSTQALSAATTYYWRVQDNLSNWSSIYSFIVDAGSPSYSGPQVSIGSSGPWTNLPQATALSSTVVSARITVQDSVAGLLVSTGPPNGLAGQWHFNEGTGGFALDSSTNAHDGTIVNSTFTQSRNGLGQAVSLNGANGYVRIPYKSDLIIKNDITISAWIKRNKLLSNGPLLTRHSASTRWSYEYYFASTDNKLRFRSDAAVPQVSMSSGSIDDNSWHHVAVARQGSSVNFYIDGRPTGSVVMSGAFNDDIGDAIDLGCDNDCASGLFDGAIDEVQLYAVALSTAQILALYQSSSLNAQTLNAAYHVMVSTNAGTSWTYVSTNNVTLTGGNGAQSAQTLQVNNLQLVNSTGTNAPTNRIAFVTSDMAGNVSTAAYVVLVDTHNILWNGNGSDGACGGAGTANNWSCGANWLGGVAPGTGDVATFDATSVKNSSITANISVAGVNILSGYAGTIVQKTGVTITLGASGWAQADGIFAGGDSNIAFAAAAPFTLSGGSYAATSAITSFSDNVTVTYSSGTFNHNNGTWKFDTVESGYVSAKTYTFTMTPSSMTFYHLSARGGSNYDADDFKLSVATGKTLVVQGDFTLSGSSSYGNMCLSGGGTIDLRGNFKSSSRTCRSTSAYVGKILFSGSADQTYQYAYVNCQYYSGNAHICTLPAFEINKPAGTVTPFAGTTELNVSSFTLSSGTFTAPTGTMSTRNDFSLSSGTFNHNNGTFAFDALQAGFSYSYTYKVSIPGASFNFWNLKLLGSDDFTGGTHTLAIPSGKTLTALNDLTIQKGVLGFGNNLSNGGTLEVQGNATIGVGANGGTSALNFTGTNAQTFTNAGGTNLSGTVTVLKAAGTLTLASRMTLSSAGQDLTVSSGTLDMGNGYGLTVNDVLTLSSAALVQRSGPLSAGAISVGSGSTWINNSTGSITVGSGGVSNNGYIRLDGSGAGCGDSSLILINSDSPPTQRDWSGSGTFRLFDLDVRNQTSTPALTVYNGAFTNATANWTLNAACPTNCADSLNVKKDGSQDYRAISAALGSLPQSLPRSVCIVVKDTETYSEQVTVQNFAFPNSTSTLKIMADPTFVSSAPVVTPPTASTAAFAIANASVTIQNITVITTNTVQYGVWASSAYVAISSVNVIRGSGDIWTAGIQISSWTTVANSSITVNTAHGLYIAGEMNAVSFSTALSNTTDNAYYALYLNGASSNVITNFYSLNPTRQATILTNGSNYNTISQSTMTGNSSNCCYVLSLFNGASSNTLTSLYVGSSGSADNMRIYQNVNYNTVSFSTMASTGVGTRAFVSAVSAYNTLTHNRFIGRNRAMALQLGTESIQFTVSYNQIDGDGNSSIRPALSIESASHTITGCNIVNTSGHAVLFNSVAVGNTISYSTLTSLAATAGFYGVYFNASASNTVTNSYIQGSYAAYALNSTGTVINSSVLVATGAVGYGILMQGGSNLSASSNTITGGSQGAGIYLGNSQAGSISISTNTIMPGAQYGIYIATQSSPTSIWIASNTIMPALSDTLDTYGIYLNGLASGATIQNNAVVYRTAGGTSGRTYYGLYGQSVRGLNVDHNRINQPGQINNGSFIGASFSDAQYTQFKFNDVNSTAAAMLQTAYLLQLVNSTVTVRDNIFFSSVTVSVSSASLWADQVSGFDSDYNDWYSTHSAAGPVLIWNGKTYAYPWGLGKDASSIRQNPLWFNTAAGVEDFHPMSAAPSGRFNMATGLFDQTDSTTSATIDAAQPSPGESVGLEPTPNGGRANQGSYGQTEQASKSAQTCANTTSAQTGLWSLGTTWDSGYVPTACNAVTIAPTHQVTVDITTATASTTTVSGILSFSRVASSSFTLVLGSMTVSLGGTLDMGTEASPIPTGTTAQLVLAYGSSAGQYGLTVNNGGNFTVRGATKTPFGFALASIPASATSLTISASSATGWQTGDVITIGPTTGNGIVTTATRTITGITGSDPLTINWSDQLGAARTLTSTSPIVVTNMTRNVLVRSSGTVVTAGGNSSYIQNLARNATSFTLTYGEFVYLGANSASKYGITFDGSATRGAISSSTIRNGYDGIFLDNSSSNTLIGNNIYAQNQYGIYLNAGSSTTLLGNLVYGNSFYPVRCEGSIGNAFTGNYFYSNADIGVYVNNSCDRNTFTGNNSYSQYQGFNITASLKNTFTGNNSYANSNSGIVIQSGSNNNTFNGNNSYSNGNIGFYVNSSVNNAFIGNTSYLNSSYGIHLNGSSNNNTFINQYSYSNQGAGYGLILTGSINNAFIGGALGYDSAGVARANAINDLHFDAVSGVESLILKATRISPAGGVSTTGMNTVGTYLLSYNQDYATGTVRLWGNYQLSGSTLTLDHSLQLYASTFTAPKLMRGVGHSLSAVVVRDTSTLSELITVTHTGGSSWQVVGSSSGILGTLSCAPSASGCVFANTNVDFNLNAGAVNNLGDSLDFLTLAASNDANVQKRLLFGPSASSLNFGRTKLEVDSTGGVFLRGKTDGSANTLIDMFASGSTYYTFVDSGAFTAERSSFTNADSGGIQLSGSAGIAISSSTFDFLGFVWATNTYITARSLTAGATCYDNTFALSRSSAGFASAYNVRVEGTDSGLNLTFRKSSTSLGQLWGEAYDDDLNNKVVWALDGVVYAPIAGCGITKNVLQAGGADALTISGGVSALPATLNDNACVVIRDAQTYSEQVTVQNFAFTYSTNTLKIMADPTFVSSAPVVTPPTASTAAFAIANASVTIQNINIITTNTVQYGINASSAYITISSVNIDAGGNPSNLIWNAGISISSFSLINYSSVTVQLAHGIWVVGSSNTISLTTMSNNSPAKYGLYLNGASSNTITGCFISLGTTLNGGAAYNTISRSTIASQGGTISALDLNNASHNSFIQSNILNPSGPGAQLTNNSNFNSISQSTLTTALSLAYFVDSSSFNSISQSTLTTTGNFTVFITAANNNTVTQNYIGGSYAGIILSGGNSNTVSQNTITGGSYLAMSIDNASSLNTILQNSIDGGAGYGLKIVGGSYANTASQNTVVNNSAPNAALTITGDNNSFSSGRVSNLGGYGAYVDSSSNSISLSTITSDTPDYSAVLLKGSSNTISSCYVQGSTAVYITGGSTGTVINASVLVGNGNPGSGLRMDNTGNMHLSMSSNVITGSGQGAGIYLDKNNKGSISLSTNTILPGAQYGIYVATQTAGASVWITSNTIISTATAANNVYGIYINGLASGATIYNNALVLRNAANTGANTSYGLYAQTVPNGLNVHHNRINNPDMIAGGNYVGAYFADASSVTFNFNDVNSTATAKLNTAYLLQLLRSTATVRNNIFFSSVTVSVSSASLFADRASGFDSDYNDWFSSHSVAGSVLIWNGKTYTYPWGLGKDANSISANPYWFNPSAGVEDFHPTSIAGRYNTGTGAFVIDGANSQTIDKGDTAEDVTIDIGLGLEPSPNGSRANQGSYGRTAQASKSAAAGCVTSQSVKQAGGGTCTTIGQCVANIPTSALTGDWCIDIQDSATYSERVTVQNKNPNNFQIRIGALTGNNVVNVNPPTSSTAAFVINNSSVTLFNLNIITTNTVAYGISISSAYVAISSVNIDSNNKIWTAGIRIPTNYNTISYSSITVQQAHGIWVTGQVNRIITSSMAANSDTQYALYLNGASSNTITGCFMSSGTVLDSTANYNNITLSSMTSNSGVNAYLATEWSSSNTVRSSFIYNAGGTAAKLNISANDGRNTISQSTIIALGEVALYLYGNGSIITQDYIHSSGERAIFGLSPSYNTISQSTITSDANTAFNFNGGSSNTLTGNYFASGAGFAVYSIAASYNTFSQSTMSSLGVAMYFDQESTRNIVTQSFITSQSADAIQFVNGSKQNTISFSTIVATCSGCTSVAAVTGASSVTITNSYLEGDQGAVYIGESSGTVLYGNVLVSHLSNWGVVHVAASGASGLYMSSNTIFGKASGYGVFVDAGNSGPINLSTNTISGAQYGINIGTLTANSTVWITSNTIVSTITSAGNTYGIYLNGLTTGATIQNNSIVWRSGGTMGANTAYGLYAQSVRGLNVDHNRISQPGQIAGGKFVGAYFTDAQYTQFKFNDVNSTATAVLNTGYLLQLNNSTVTVRNNIFQSSMTVSLSSASLFADRVSGFDSDYNDWYSSNSLNTAVWGSSMTQFTFGAGWWGKDSHSIAANPLWNNPSAGVEDFHPLSTAGRCLNPPACDSFHLDGQDSPTIDAGDPNEPQALVSVEPDPNGFTANQGSTGETIEASKSPDILSITLSTNSYDFGTIDRAVYSSTISLSSVTAINSGNIRESYQISAATITAGSRWLLGAAPGIETIKLQGLFNSAQPVDSNFDAVSSTVSGAPTACGGGGGNYDGDSSDCSTVAQAGCNGKQVPVRGTGGIWFKITAPTSTKHNNEPQVIRMTFTAIKDP